MLRGIKILKRFNTVPVNNDFSDTQYGKIQKIIEVNTRNLPKWGSLITISTLIAGAWSFIVDLKFAHMRDDLDSIKNDIKDIKETLKNNNKK